MSSSRPITECFKMKKPRPSPAKDAAAKQCRTTPKRRAPRRKITPSKAPEPKPHCGEEPSEDQREDQATELNSHDPDLWLCSQDVPVSDIGWDYSSPRSKVLKAKKKGDSDVAGLVGLFRHNPAETRPRVWDLIESNFGGPSANPPGRPRGRTGQKRAEDVPNREVLFERMQGLLQLMEDNRNGESGSCVVEAAERDAEEAEETLEVRIGTEDSPKIRAEEPPVTEGADDGDWADGDDSILVAATQEAEMAAAPLGPRMTPKRSEARARNASPLQQNVRWKSSGLRKSPRLQSMNKKTSPRVLSTLVPSAVPATAAVPATPVKSAETSENAKGSFKDIMENLLADDEDDALLDWVCSSYEQAQRLARAAPIQAKNGIATSPRNNHPSRATASTTFCIPKSSRRSPAKAVAALANSPSGTRVHRSSAAVPVVVLNRMADVPKGSQTAKRPGETRSNVQRAEPKASGQRTAAPLRPKKQEATETEWDDDDDEFTTPEVVSWLEKVESQTSQRCTPQEIEQKRREALLRRQQRWKGRLRTPK